MHRTESPQLYVLLAMIFIIIALGGLSLALFGFGLLT